MLAQTALILDGDGRAGLACAQSLARAGLNVHIGVRRLGSQTQQSRTCHRLHLQPPAEPRSAAIDWLRELDHRFPFTLIVPLGEISLHWLRILAETDTLRLKAQLPSHTALESAMNRASTRAIARQLGLPVPNTRVLPPYAGGNPPVQTVPTSRGPDDASPLSAYPRLIKAISGAVATEDRLVHLNPTLVHNETQRATTLDSWRAFTAVQEQEWVGGCGIGVEILYEHGRLAWHFVHERLHEWPLRGGPSTLRRAAAYMDAQHELIAMTRSLLDQLQWHGAALVDWQRDVHGKLYFSDLTPRLCSSLPLTIAAGIDLPCGLLRLARAEPLPAAQRWRAGLTARSLSEDLRWRAAEQRLSPKSPALYTEPFWRTTLGWLRPLIGREIWDGWSWRDPGPACAEIRSLLRTSLAAPVRRIERHAALARAIQHHTQLTRPGGALSRPVRSILFICLGNLCRSPFAESATRLKLPGLVVDSAGFLHHDGRSSPSHVLATARLLGIDITAARAKRISQQQIDSAQLIICMELSHLTRLSDEFPDALTKTTLLGLFNPPEGAEIQDPYTLAPVAIQAIFHQMLCAIDAMAARIAPLQR